MIRQIAYALIACSLPLLTFRAACAQTPPGNAFVGQLRQVHALGNGKLALLTSEGVYLGDDNDLTHWTARTARPADIAIVDIVGGGGDRLFFTATTRDSKMASGGPQLLVWTPAHGFELLPPHIPAHGLCDFVDEKVGCYANHAGIVLTLDGGKTWLDRQDLFLQVEDIYRLKWVASDSLLACSNNGALMLCHLTADGHLNTVWTINPAQKGGKQEESIDDFAVDSQERLWTINSANKLQVRKLIDKTIQAEADLKSHGTSIIAWGNAACVGRESGLDLWRITDNKLEKTGSKEKVDWIESETLWHNNAYAVMSGVAPNAMALVHLENEITKIAQISPTTVDNQAIVKAGLLPEDASPEEFSAMMDLARQLPGDVVNRVGAAAKNKQGLTERQRVKFVTDEFKRLLAEKQATSQPGK